ncbi:hypothetical protein [Nannocystis pusilla]|uniref:hypothetical protein n=1 Tax=Nannocystis pusilla TaxID=889268 RepID=UPI003DA59853
MTTPSSMNRLTFSREDHAHRPAHLDRALARQERDLRLARLAEAKRADAAAGDDLQLVSHDGSPRHSGRH